jgi:hypothetical protein
MDVERLLQRVRDGDMAVEEAITLLRDLPFKDIGCAKIDYHRKIRRGIPEAVYAPGKTVEQVRAIVADMRDKGTVFVTRASADVVRALRDIGEYRYYPECALMVVGLPVEKPALGPVAIVTGGTCDLPVAEEAAVTLEEMGVSVSRIYDAGAAGIHRLVSNSETLQKAQVVIAVAGMDGILPTVTSNFTQAVVIAVPTSVGYGTGLGGVAALMAMLNACSPGIVTVNIDNGFGAGIAAYLMVRTRQ